jgi:cyclopropane fatty-acyl-phospholipid synthase-like methyltransferase
VRANVLVEAQRELERGRLQNKQPVLVHCTDFATLPSNHTFDFVWAFAVFIHMTDDVCSACLHWVSRQLNPTGVFFADALLEPQRRETLSHGMGTPFPVIRRPLADYQQMAGAAGLRLQDMGTLMTHGSRLRSEGRLRTMLRLTHAAAEPGYVNSASISSR